MSVDTAIAYFRQRQQDLFRDAATVTRITGPYDFDPETGVPTHTVTTVHVGACLLRAMAWQGSDSQYGDEEVRLRSMRFWFPPDTDIQYDDVIVPSSSEYDPSLVGRSFRVTDVWRDGWQIARKGICEEITG